MSHDFLAITWFGLWGLIWTVYFVLDGYTLGTGMLLPFVSKNRQERRQLQEAIGPFWNGNEVWLITAGGATFAAFPVTYANMFSYLYEALFLILFAIFFRACGLEFMHKVNSEKWQASWKWAFAIASFLIALLFGVAFANLYRGLLIGENGYEGNLISLLNPYGILGGVLFVAMFLFSGSLWIQLKTSGETAIRSKKLSRILAMVAAAVLAIFFVATMNWTPLAENFNELPVLWVIPSLSLLTIIFAVVFAYKDKVGFAFTSICLAIVTQMATGFVGMFPNMLPSKISSEYSITLYNASGSTLNLKIMFVVACIFVPIVLAYQIWSYVLFKDKIAKEDAKGY
jgi:cytochrome bd ubiquinol oxidase subunit II